MRIGIDCRLSGTTHAGIGRYIENLITRLPKLAPGVTWVFFFYDRHQIPLSLQKVKNVELRLAPILHYTLAEQLQLPKIFADAQLDLLHVPHFNVPLFYQGQLAITIHDLLWHEHKGTQVTTLNPLLYWFKYFAYRLIATRAIRRATTIFVPAHTVKDTLLRYYPKIESKIVITKEGVSGEFASLASAHHPPTKNSHLIYVGSLYPHKNVSVVLRALKNLPEYHLDIVGSRNVFQQHVKAQVKDLRLENQVTFHGFVSDEKLAHLLTQSVALVQPSLSEGFGLTGVEAMAAGVPVIASDIPIFREIYQDAACYFDPHSPASFRETILQLTKNKLTRLRKKGRVVASQYSWDAMAQHTVRAYQKNSSSS